MVGLHDDAVRRLMTVAVEGRRFIAWYGDDLRRLPLGRSEIGRCGECDRDQRKEGRDHRMRRRCDVACVVHHGVGLSAPATLRQLDGLGARLRLTGADASITGNIRIETKTGTETYSVVAWRRGTPSACAATRAQPRG